MNNMRRDDPGGRAAAPANLSRWALLHPRFIAYAMLVLFATGVAAYIALGRDEDPPFTVKQMVIQAQWPGASAEQMAADVTDPLERKLEELPYLDYVESQTSAGRVTLTVNLRDDTPPDQVQPAWYQVRKKIGDMQAALPDGLQGPYFNDEFGDVYGQVYAITGDGFSLPQLKHVAEDVREGLLGVPGIGKVELLGTQDERIYADIIPARLAQYGVSMDTIAQAIQDANAVAPAGFVETPEQRIYLRSGGGIDNLTALQNLPIAVAGRLIPLGDLVTISRGLADPPQPSIRFDGKPALELAISLQHGGDIVALGRGVRAALARITPALPLGVTLHPVDDQPAVVAQSAGEFETSFYEALIIVLGVSLLTLGWRPGLVVAIAVPLTLACVMVALWLLGIDLQRISLGAMIIALGLLVDDAIISVETMLVKLGQGWTRLEAGSFAYHATAFPMLTGTLVTASGFLPVGLAQSVTGEYTKSMFWVVCLALVFSWFVAVLFVPYLGAKLLRPKPQEVTEAAYYDTPLYRRARRLLVAVLARPALTVGVTCAVFGLAAGGFFLIPQQFFPSSARLELVVDLRLPEGSAYRATDAAVHRLERFLAGQPGIVSQAAYIGSGGPRFFLASVPVLADPNVAQIVINTASLPAREHLLATIASLARDPAAGFDDDRLRVSRLALGPLVTYPVQFRISGPDPETLRQIGAKAGAILLADPHLWDVSGDWGNAGQDVQVEVDQDKAQMLGMTTRSLDDTLQTLLQGRVVSGYREGTDVIPIMLRADAADRGNLSALGGIVLATPGGPVPLASIARIRFGVEMPFIIRRARLPTLTMRADILDATQAPAATAQVQPAMDQLAASLPPGYHIATGGTAEASQKSQDSVFKIMPLVGLVMVTLLMIQTQSVIRTMMVLMTAPLGLIGVTAGLLLTGDPFGFVAQLGFIALSGIIMRNAIILLDQIDHDIASGLSQHEAIITATLRRTRPILLTAATALLALVPLAGSIFWGPMAVVLMGGLTSATVLTLIFLPALYMLCIKPQGGTGRASSRAERDKALATGF